DGMDNCKEMSVLFAGLEFARRGMNTLAIDGPGQGEALRLRRIHARHDYEVPGTAAYEFVARRPDVDAKRVIIMGYSFGGYYAPRVAAFERRYAACVCLGALHWDLHAWQSKIKEQLKADPKKSAQSNFQFRWILGLDDSDTALERAKEFSLAGVADKITCPVLVTHGANDRVVPVDAAHRLYAALTTKKKTLKIFTAEEGGAEHCQVDNRPPDVYTLLGGNVGPLAIGRGLYKKLGYDVAKDFEPVSLVATLPFVLFASPVLPANSVVELLAYARAHPGELNFGSTGVGSGLHLIGELFKSVAGIEIVHVPYKGVAQALPEMMSGKVQIAFNTIPAFLPHVKSGRLKALVITSTLRSPLLPDVPTTPEVGLPGVLGASWHAVVAPAGTPREIVNKLNV